MAIRVAVAGAGGRMGRTVLRAVHNDPECVLVAAWDPSAGDANAGELAGLTGLELPIAASAPEALAAGVDVVVDFTRAAPAVENARASLAAGAAPVIGTTGLSAGDLEELRSLAERHSTPCFLAPNFALGAVLMMLFAQQAARYLPEVEIIEFHGPQKVDAPSGTAMRTLELIEQTRAEGRVVRPNETHEILPGARGGDRGGVRIHSVRLPGCVAHQEVIFGDVGQTLTLRHDSIDRESFMPGVLLAVKKVRGLQGLVVGLERLLDL